MSTLPIFFVFFEKIFAKTIYLFYLCPLKKLIMARVSIKDVANTLDVSAATVSLVLNGRDKDGRISEVLAEKIRNKAKDMNYKPNSFAKGLRSGRSETIGLIVADISNSFFSSLAFHIQEQAEKCGYSVIIANTNEKTDKMEKMISILKSRQVDGFIIVSTEHGEKQIEKLVRDKIPVVLLDRYFKGIDVSYVGVNNYQAAMEATNLLLNLNCKRIVHMTYKHNISPMQDRKQGYIAALTNRGLYDSKLIKEINYWTINRDIPNMVMELLSSEEKVDGFFFASSTIAFITLKKILALKLEIPKDIKVVCFSKNDIFEFPNIFIPYIQQPTAEIGKRAVELIIAHITQKDAPNVHEILQAKLVF